MVREAGETVGVGGDNFEAIWRVCSGYAHGQPWSLLAVGERTQLEGQSPEALVHDYRVTADAPMVWTAVSAAFLATNHALRLREQYRRRWYGKDAVNV